MSKESSEEKRIREIEKREAKARKRRQQEESPFRAYYLRNKTAFDVLLSFLQWLLVTVLSFFYWMAMLLLLSLFLVNVWITSFWALLRYGIILTIVTGLVYGGILLRRKFRER